MVVWGVASRLLPVGPRPLLVAPFLPRLDHEFQGRPWHHFLSLPLHERLDHLGPLRKLHRAPPHPPDPLRRDRRGAAFRGPKRDEPLRPLLELQQELNFSHRLHRDHPKGRRPFRRE